MSLESYIQAMPKVDVHIHFEGSIPRDTVMRMVEQNDIASGMKQREYNEWMALLQKPDMKKLDDMARGYASWLRYPEDLSRAVYEVGLQLHRQNIRYAEVHINPAIYTDNGLAFETFLDAINEGRDKVLRGWQVKMDWVLTIPRDRPRKGDDVSRWATSATARKGNVIGMGIIGREDLQPADQFQKAFQVVERRDIPTETMARSTTINPETLISVVTQLNPSRLVDVWGIATDADALAFLSERQLPVVVTPSREMRLNRISNLKDYPLKELMANLKVAIGANLPEFYRTNLTEELQGLAKAQELTAEDVETLILNAIDMSFLAAENKEAMSGEFKTLFAELRPQHLS